MWVKEDPRGFEGAVFILDVANIFVSLQESKVPSTTFQKSLYWLKLKNLPTVDVCWARYLMKSLLRPFNFFQLLSISCHQPSFRRWQFTFGEARSQQNHTNFIPYQNISKLTSMLIVVLHFMFFVWKKLSDRISFLSTFCSFIFNNLRLGLLQNSTNLIFKYFFNAKSSTQNIQQNISTILQLYDQETNSAVRAGGIKQNQRD